MPPEDVPPKDPTPEFAAPTDIAPLGRGAEKPAHERTAAEDRDVANWGAIATDPDFRSLLRAKAKFIVPVTVFFIVYYFALPILVGWFPEMMSVPVLGEANMAYLFALSQFFMAWIVALFYVIAAAGWDRRAAAVLRKFQTS